MILLIELTPIKRVKRDGDEGGSFGEEGGESGGGGIIQNALLQSLLSQMASSMSAICFIVKHGLLLF
jgi:hypothetical protein